MTAFRDPRGDVFRLDPAYGRKSSHGLDGFGGVGLAATSWNQFRYGAATDGDGDVITLGHLTKQLG